MISAGSLCLLIQSWVGVYDWGSGGKCRSHAHIQLQGRLGGGDACMTNFCRGALPHCYYNKESFSLNLGKGFR